MLDRNWNSLKPFKFHGAENMNAEESEKKRYRLQSAYLIKDFIERTRSLQQLNLKANRLGNEGIEVIAEALARSKCTI